MKPLQYFIVPGLGGSSINHWQSHFENEGSHFIRIQQQNWNEPDIEEWIKNIDNALSRYQPEDIVLVGHSLGCLTIAAWAEHYQQNIRGALLVAPPDMNRLHQHLQRILFEKEPLITLPFQSTVVASTNDPWAAITKAEEYADHWNSEFINIGDTGHINELSGHGHWKEGLEILYSRFKESV